MDLRFSGVERRRIYDIVNVLESIGVRLLSFELLKFPLFLIQIVVSGYLCTLGRHFLLFVRFLQGRRRTNITGKGLQKSLRL